MADPALLNVQLEFQLSLPWPDTLAITVPNLPLCIMTLLKVETYFLEESRMNV